MEKPNRPPDPGEKFAYFLDWLLKHHHLQSLDYCEKKQELEQNLAWSDIDLRQCVRSVGITKVTIQTLSSHSQTIVVIRIVDQNWARDWAHYYKEKKDDFPREHHRAVTHKKKKYSKRRKK